MLYDSFITNTKSFSQRIQELALKIPPGRVTTYGILVAAAGGHPMMARMVTSILAKSPDVDKIPFHRIIYSNGKFWSSPKYDKIRKKLYRMEDIHFDKNNRITNFAQIVYLFDDL